MCTEYDKKLFKNINFCPFMRDHWYDYYCTDMLKLNVNSILYYCIEHFNECDSYKKTKSIYKLD
jgi:hypothetical protein